MTTSVRASAAFLPLKFFLWALALQFIVIVPVGEKGSGIRLYHLLAIPAILYAAFHPRTGGLMGLRRTARWDALLYLGGCLFISIALLPQFSFPDVAPPAFALATYIIGLGLVRIMPVDRLTSAFRGMGAILFLAVFVKNALYARDLVAAMTGGQDALWDVAWITAGGPNIEASILAFMLVPFLHRRAFWPLAAFVLLCGLAYQSRTGLIMLLLVLVYKALNGTRRAGRILAWFSVGAAVVVAASSAAVADRFANIGEEANAEMGRAFLWAAGATVVQERPQGLGPGQGIRYVEDTTGINLVENNFHNIYLQAAIDYGWIASLLLVALALRRISWLRTHPSPFVVMSCLYLVSGTVEFVGTDTIGWLFIGVADALSRSRPDNSH